MRFRCPGAKGLIWAPLLAWTACSLGCGGGMPAKASPEKAKQALEIALDAWQKGESIEELTKGSPVIYFNDPKCRDGMRLKAFTIAEGHDYHGQSVRMSAAVTLVESNGKTKERKVAYIVDTSPVVVIAPD